MKNKFPDPPKPPLPPPPLPPYSSLLGFERRLTKNNYNKLSVNAEREHLVYSRFLQNFIFKYNNRNLHKLCNKIDLSNLEYLIVSEANNNNNKNIIINNNRLFSGGNSSSGSRNYLTWNSDLFNNSSNSYSSNNNINYVVNGTSRIGLTKELSNFTGNMTISVVPKFLNKQSTNNNKFGLIENQNVTSTTTSDGLFDLEDYLISLFNKFYANPWQFFFDSLFIPLVVLSVLIIVIVVGFIFKR